MGKTRITEKSKREELIEKFNEFLDRYYNKELVEAANEGKPLVISFEKLDATPYELSDILINNPDEFFELANEALNQKDLPNPVKIRVKGGESVMIRDLRAKHLGKFITVEGIVRRASEIRPQVIEIIWLCEDCNEIAREPKLSFRTNFEIRCPRCKKSSTLIELEKKMIDSRHITIEEPFELTEGERPSQLNIVLSEDLVSPDGRRMTDPGNRIKISGILREMSRKKSPTKLDFFLEANYVEPTEIGWKHLEITKEDEKRIKELAQDPMIYEKFINSIAPSLYGLKEIKEAIVLQMFGGVPRIMKDCTRFRGD
ncbi:MAG: MCM family protein, partial [Candidatus Aenigmatarchaeota archaeon]